MIVADDRKVSEEGEPETSRPTGPPLAEGLDLGRPAFGSFDVTGVGREERLVQHPVRIALSRERLRELGDRLGVARAGGRPATVGRTRRSTASASPMRYAELARRVDLLDRHAEVGVERGDSSLDGTRPRIEAEAIGRPRRRHRTGGGCVGRSGHPSSSCGHHRQQQALGFDGGVVQGAAERGQLGSETQAGRLGCRAPRSRRGARADMTRGSAHGRRRGRARAREPPCASPRSGRRRAGECASDFGRRAPRPAARHRRRARARGRRRRDRRTTSVVSELAACSPSECRPSRARARTSGGWSSRLAKRLRARLSSPARRYAWPLARVRRARVGAIGSEGGRRLRGAARRPRGSWRPTRRARLLRAARRRRSAGDLGHGFGGLPGESARAAG